jgi:hypothetical protein
VRQWKGNVKAKTPGTRGYDYYHQQRAGSYMQASSWARDIVLRVESAGSRVILVQLIPEDE